MRNRIEKFLNLEYSSMVVRSIIYDKYNEGLSIPEIVKYLQEYLYLCNEDSETDHEIEIVTEIINKALNE